MKIDKEKCSGCGACEAEFPEIFKLEGGKAEIIKDISLTKDLKELCYFDAIEK